MPANEGILIRDSGGEDNYLGFIRIIRSYTKRKVEILKLEFSTSESTWYFESRAGGSLQLKDIVDHYWKDVPVVEFVNNEERIGDLKASSVLWMPITQSNRIQQIYSNITMRR